MDLASRLAAAAAAGAASSDAELASLVQSLPGGDARREQACETLVARYQPVIRACVHRYSVTLDLADELTQVGYVGLMKAINNFDPQLGTNLAAYARSCASGEIKRYFRDRRWQIRVRRSVQELWLEIRDATTVLTQELARAPLPAELAEYLQVGEEQIAEAQSADRAFQAVSLDARVTDQADAASVGDMLGEDDASLEHAVDIESVKAHWPELDDRAQLLLTLRFYGNMSQDEIGERLGVSQMQVSRLLRRALDYLRSRLTSLPPKAAVGHHEAADP